MKPPDEVARRLARDWMAKAATDLLVCEQLLGRGAVFHEAVAFHAYAPVPEDAAITCVSLARKVYDEIARRLPEDIWL